MTEVSRAIVTLSMTVALSGCAMFARDRAPGPTVPPPITPVQKETAAPENPDSVILADFNARLDRYVKTQRSLLKDAPIKKDATPAEIKAREETLAAQLRTIRRNAKHGDIFPPTVAALFKRLMYPEVKGPQLREVKQTLVEEDGDRAEVWLKVNATYPVTHEPLATTPANLLANLPQLPKDVEYRIVGKHLLLRDVDGNIIVDFIYNAIR